MRIVLVTPFLPLPDARHGGGKVVFQLLRTLGLAHEVHLVARVTDEDAAQLDRLEGLARSITTVPGPSAGTRRSFVNLLRVVASYVRLCRAGRAVAHRVGAQLVQVEFSETGFFWRPLDGVPAVLTCIDILAKPAFRLHDEAPWWRKPVAGLRLAAVRMAEGRAVRKFDRIFVLSEVDRTWAVRSYPQVEAAVLSYPADPALAAIERSPDVARVLYVGALNRVENQRAVDWFIEGCWRQVRSEVPTATLEVVGNALPAELAARWGAVPGVEIVGAVASVLPNYARATVCIAPILTGGGVIVKVLDALAARVPLVTTSRGDEGIGAGGYGAAMVADSGDEFARMVILLLREPARREQIAAMAGRFVAERRSSRALADCLDVTYAALAARE